MRTLLLVSVVCAVGCSRDQPGPRDVVLKGIQVDGKRASRELYESLRGRVGELVHCYDGEQTIDLVVADVTARLSTDGKLLDPTLRSNFPPATAAQENCVIAPMFRWQVPPQPPEHPGESALTLTIVFSRRKK
jgi:hypothetical protein